MGDRKAADCRLTVILSIIVRDEAEQDILEASRWYEDRAMGLGLEFIRGVDTCLLQISRAPALGPVVFRDARMTLLRRFPYLVIYKVFEDYISVVAVMQGNRHPRRWKSRLPK